MSLAYHAKISQPGQHFFTLEMEDVDEDAAAFNASYRAWLALGYDDIGDEAALSSYKKAKLSIAFNVALETEALRCAYQSPELRWLIEQNADFDITPYSWAVFTEFCWVDIELKDDATATLFKLTFGGAA